MNWISREKVNEDRGDYDWAYRRIKLPIQRCFWLEKSCARLTSTPEVRKGW